MRLLITGTIFVLLGGVSGGAQADKPNFSGKWKLNSATSELHGSRDSIWTVQQSDKDIHIAETADGGSTTELKCTTGGQECDLNGRKVRLWYNGPKLVIMDSQGKNGSTVIKRRLSLSDDGNLLQVEVFHIVPQGQTEKLVFVKQEAATADAKAKR